MLMLKVFRYSAICFPMPVEIERKFLVHGSSWKALVNGRGLFVRQGYICVDPQRTVRVRVHEKESFLTIKTARIGISRNEFEYPIPFSEACELLECACIQPLIKKTRYHIPWGDFVIEVDEFHGGNEGLIIAEVELPAEDAVLKIPDWFGKEVSQDDRYQNSHLVTKPYSTWNSV